MEYKYNQKMAIVRLLLDIISIDEKIDERRRCILRKSKKS